MISDINLLEELDNVSKLHFLDRNDIETLMLEFGRRIVAVLKIERINVWLFTADKDRIVSIGEYDALTNLFSKDSTILKKDIPNYFETISKNKIVLVPNVYQDVITSELADFYFKPNNIISLMDIPLRMGGELIGIICFEKTGGLERHFDSTEQTFALSLSIVLASNLEARYRRAYQNKLEETLLELKTANAELDSFSYSVSHDLKSPLRALIGYSRILEEDYGEKLDEEGKKLLTRIHQNGHRMSLLIDGLLDFSKLGKKEIRKHSVDMMDCVNTLIHDFKKTVAPNTRFVVHELPPIEGDPSLLLQVWTNLISNALKYSSKKEAPEIEIGSYLPNTPDQHHLVYFVKDNGAGFDMKHAHKLFGVFQRLHSNEDFEGTGIGLAITARIIDKHGGKIWAEGQPSNGATFYFSLPVSPTSLNTDPQSEEA